MEAERVTLRTATEEPPVDAVPTVQLAGRAVSELVAEVVAATGLLSADSLAAVRDRSRSGSFSHALVQQGIGSGERVARDLADRFGMPLVDLPQVGVSREAAHRIPLQVLERVAAIPYAYEDGVLRVAIADPQNLHGIDELRLASDSSVELAVAARDDIVAEVRRLARAAEAFGARAMLDEEDDDDEAAQEQNEDDLEADDGISEAPLVRLVNSLIFQAAEDGASDMHFEPNENGVVVRFRTDGVLHEVQRIPKRLAPGVITRLKVLAKMDIAERRKPQDGRISLGAKAAGRTLDVRVASLPTVDGEKLAMRLLDKSKQAPTLEELGLNEEMRQIFGEVDDALRRPDGDQPARDQRDHGRGPGRIPASRRQPGADQRQGGPHVRGRAALDPALRPRRGDGGRDPRLRDGQDLDRGRADRSLRPVDAAHQRRAGRDHAPERDGRRAVLDRLRRVRGARSAPRAQALHALLRDVQPVRRRAPAQSRLARCGGGHGRCSVLPEERLPTVWSDRLQGSHRHLPAPRDDRGHRAPRRDPRDPRRAGEEGVGPGNAHALGRRPRQGGCRCHDPGGGRPCPYVAASPFWAMARPVGLPMSARAGLPASPMN